ncbi:AAA family ATPase [Flavobacteriaceae bacterium R38]|nr:AAA family ATPase [Flavobacteriaceae bacterium R38]
MINNYISYFSKCYQADNRDFSISNFFSSKYESQYIIKKEEELVNRKLPIQFIPTKNAEKIVQTLTLFKNDKELFYCTLFCLGKRKNFQKKTTSVAAPLFYYKASVIEKEGDYFIKINDHSERHLNVGFLKTLDFSTSFDLFHREAEDILNNYDAVSFEFLSVFKRLCQKHINNLNFDTLLFPKLKTQTALKNALKDIEKEEDFNVASASGVFISSKADNINAVVNELNSLKKNNSFSKALTSFFSTEKEAISKLKTTLNSFALLNQAQEQIVFNANKFSKSVIYGPPGTGKTYTIAAIAKDYVSKGKSVLIATKTTQALEVIEQKLEASGLDQFYIKIGGNYYRRKLLSRLRRIANNFYGKHYDKAQLEYLNNQKKRYTSKLDVIKHAFSEKIEKENKRVDKKFSERFFERISNSMDIKWLRKYEDEEWDIIDQYFKVLDSSVYNNEFYLQQKIIHLIVDYAAEERLELINLINTFETDEKSLKTEYLKSISARHLTHLLPIWLVKIDKVSEGLPLKKDLFDIAIIDEATQCDIASSLPILQRAKKVVVAGDTNQLRHISFLSTVQMLSFQKEFGLKNDSRFNYRNKSLLDFTLEHIPESRQIVLLDEHYRSLPDIISFSNKMFYNNSLRIMTQTPKNNDKKSVFVKHINGTQLNNGVNEEEAKSILDYILGILKNEESLTKKQATSIGILSPFRQQTDFLAKMIKKEIGLNLIKKHRIRLGTPYHFQGEERDMMLISMTIDNNSHYASLNYLDKEDIFNVAITRARHKQIIYLSSDIEKLKPESLLRQYISSININEINSHKKEDWEDIFNREICQYLSKLEVKIYNAYNIAGLEIDILIEKNENYLGIDLIGYPGVFKEAFPLERYKILQRVGVEIIPVSYISWKYQKDLVTKKISQKIKKL